MSNQQNLRMIFELSRKLLSRCASPCADPITMAKQMRQTADLILETGAPAQERLDDTALKASRLIALSGALCTNAESRAQ